MIPHKTSYFVVFLLFFSILSCSDSNKTIYGRWKFMPKEGTDIVTWRYKHQELEITNKQEEITVVQKFFYRKKVAYVDSMIIIPGGEPRTSIQRAQNWTGNWYMGILAQVGSEKKVTGKWKEEHKVLQVERKEILQTSQGQIDLNTTREFRVDGDKLIVLEKRSTRPTPITLVFEKQS